MKPFKKLLSLVADILLSPLILAASLILRQARKSGIHKRPVSRWIFEWLGVFPLRDHYYEPLFRTRQLDPDFRERRELPGVDLNLNGQLALLKRFHYRDELLAFPRTRRQELEYFYRNGAFQAGDAEFLYNIIRTFRPKQLIEIGSGHSTLMARNAITRNRADDPGYDCRHVCIEPYEQPWLEKLGPDIVRTPVENLDRSIFGVLEAGDILFIDSSHMIRPQGDVLFEYLEVLPMLKPGVLVHVHDIFTPRDYPNEWVIDKIRFWNEQYLLEAFLSHNGRFEVIGALNYLARDQRDKLYASRCWPNRTACRNPARSGCAGSPDPSPARVMLHMQLLQPPLDLLHPWSRASSLSNGQLSARTSHSRTDVSLCLLVETGFKEQTCVEAYTEPDNNT